ncbi:MAG: hypothetical protein LBG15_03230 [Dysgonamonadaceae bacterium]|jgi:hypothetical protein|nr:hypothetical protein [Dysgonamonadaceae bacterium]
MRLNIDTISIDFSIETVRNDYHEQADFVRHIKETYGGLDDKKLEKGLKEVWKIAHPIEQKEETGA